MRPADFYALPTQETVAWHESYGPFERLFEDDTFSHEIDRHAAKAAGADALAFERKLFANVDGERTVAYDAALFQGRPFAIVVLAGRGGQDQSARLITDLDAFRAAKAYVEAWHAREDGAKEDLADADAEAAILSGTYNHAVVEHGGRTLLVSDRHIDGAGRVLFDEQAFLEAVHRAVAPAFVDDAEAFKLGIKGERMREAAIPALLEAVPAGIRATAEFGEIPGLDGYNRYQGWSPVLVAGEDATYTIGLPSWGMAGYLAWGKDFELEKVGPPELYDELAQAAAPGPR